jgi:RNA polymerase sigma factor (sigma-70 family)
MSRENLTVPEHASLSVVPTTPESPTSLTPEAIQRLVDHHRQFLAFLQTRVESRAAAEDILQSAFVKGLERGAEVREEESVVAWFYRVLRNAVIDHYRHRASTERAKEGWGKEFAAQEKPEAELKDEICQCVSGLLETLKPEYRDALRIVDVDEGSLNDLAEQVGITSGNAAVRVHRARVALRKQVQIVCGSCAEHGCLDCRCKANGSDCQPGKS